MRIRGRKGQAAVEYVLALCALLAVVGAMWYLVVASKKKRLQELRIFLC